jgi:CubicO group peptidase (beta-lactamase class C family)
LKLNQTGFFVTIEKRNSMKSKKLRFISSLMATVTMSTFAYGQAFQLPPPDATDPVTLKLMQGFPPPPDKIVRLATVLKYPNARWVVQNLRQLGPTANVWKGGTAPSALPTKLRDLDGITFQDSKGTKTSLADWQKNTYTDALLVLHKGRIVYEKYYAGMKQNQQHVLWSMSKSVTGLLATEFIKEGLLNPSATVSIYLPEMAESAYGDATVQQVLDMTSGVKYAEDFSDPSSAVFQYLIASGLVPAPAQYAGARSLTEFLPTLKKDGEHGASFNYKSADTEVVGWILQRISGKSFATLMSERLWVPLGAEEDASVWNDSIGTQASSVGVSSTLRDLGRLGELLRNDGKFNGKQIVSKATVAEIRKGADPEKFKAAKTPPRDGYSYHNHWWIPHDKDGTFEAKGLMGQHIHINPTAEIVVVKFSSHPVPNTIFTHTLDRQAFAAIASSLK